MERGFFECFFPRIISVQKREPAYWEERNHAILVRSAQIRNFFYIYQGEGQVDLRGVVYPLTKGSMFHPSLGDRFHLSSNPQNPLLYYSVHYDYRLVIWEGDTAVCQEPPDSGLPLDTHRQLYDHDLFHAALQHLYDLWLHKKAGHEWKERLAFQRILEMVVDQQRIEQEELWANQLIIESMEYIRNHYHEPLKREDLASRAALSINHYASLFKKYSGYTPMQYLVKVRLDQAKTLLRNGTAPISEVAREVGFTDPLYFTRVFSREIGFSPREYRRA